MDAGAAGAAHSATATFHSVLGSSDLRVSCHRPSDTAEVRMYRSESAQCTGTSAWPREQPSVTTVRDGDLHSRATTHAELSALVRSAPLLRP